MLERARKRHSRILAIGFGAMVVFLLASTAGATSFPGALGNGEVRELDGTYYPGDQLKVSLTADGAADFVCGIGADSASAVWPSSGAVYPKTFDYLVPSAGPVKVLVRSNAGSGNYTVDVHARRATALALSATPSSIAYGSASKLEARLTEQVGTIGVAGQTVTFYSSLDGRNWKPIGTVSSTTDTYVTSVKPTVKTYYRAEFAGNAGDDGRFRSASTNAVVTPRVWLKAPAVPKTMSANKTYVLTGYLKPKHPAGASTVRIQAEFNEGGRWVPKKTFYAKNSDAYGYTKYMANVALPTQGQWRLRAYAPADSKHAATAAGWTGTSVPAPPAGSVSVRLSDSTPVQGQTVNITARVKDIYGKPIPNARVTMTAYNNRVSRTRVVMTDASGVALWAWCP